MNICIFPGTFNPIHAAHLKMAEFALNRYNFDKVIFIPSYIPPHKNISKNLAKHRFNMVKLAISGNSKFEISDIEYKTEGKSYTLITVKKIIDEHKIKGRLNFIIGTDAFLNIKTWYHADELKDLLHFIVFPRGNDIINDIDFLGYSYELADAPKINLSSTDLRLCRESNIRTIKEYIEQNELYN
mgnify:CR=1 FL=1